MKYLILFLISFAVLISCDKELGDLKYLKTVPGGCANYKGVDLNSALSFGTDTVSYSFENGNLDLFVGFNASCCSVYNSTSEISDGTIFVHIIALQIGLCNCPCYYQYHFKFEGSGEGYKYNVTIDYLKTYNGVIKP